MSRSVHASVISELAKDAFEMAHLIKIDFATPVYLTDNAYTLSHDGNVYDPSGESEHRRICMILFFLRAACHPLSF